MGSATSSAFPAPEGDAFFDLLIDLDRTSQIMGVSILPGATAFTLIL